MNTEITETFAELGIPVNPFPGLRPFDFDESHLFFGRDGQSEQLITKLGRTHFLAVVGTSGSGKSSLVRAGLMPALLGGFMSSAGSNWRIALMRPGNDPIGNLARALNAPDVFGSEITENAALQTALAEATLRRGSRGLVDAVRHAVVGENENLLVVVDQFEEIFRLARVADDKEYGNEAAAFLKLLLEASSQVEIPIYVVLTMRSDYLGDCSQFWGLPEAINESQYLIPRLTRDQLREAMTGPVNVAHGQITPRLVARLLNDVGDDQDQLPVLQHLLMRMWDECKEKRLEVEVVNEGTTVKTPHKQVHQGEALDVCCYDAVGGMSQALSRHADEAFNELPSDRAREVAERLFKTLTEKGTDNREIRRPVTLGEICAVTGASADEVITVVETFRRPGRSFLMPPAGVALTAESLIDISHESLIRGWARLKQWVDNEARSARIYLRVAETAVLHREGGAGLWRDPDLQIALTWREQSRPNEIWARRYHPEFNQAMSFLDASVEARDADVRKEEQRRKKEINRTRLIALILGVAFLISMGVGRYAIVQSIKAQTAQEEAVKEKERAIKAQDAAILAKNDAYEQKLVAQKNLEETNKQKLAAQKNLEEANKQKLAAQTNLAEANKQRIAAQQASNRFNEEALKRLGLSAVKEGKHADAIQYFSQLNKYYEGIHDDLGQSFALTSIADTYKEQLPIAAFFSEFSESSSSDLEEMDEADLGQYMKSYYQSYFVMKALQGEDEKKLAQEMIAIGQEAARNYKAALLLNQSVANKLNMNERASAIDLSLKRGYLLESLGDLDLLKEFSLEERLTDKVKKEKLLDGMLGYYNQAREAYQQSGNSLKVAELLKRVGDLLYNDLKERAGPNPATPLDPEKFRLGMGRVVSVYEDARKQFELANKPLRQASVLLLLVKIHNTLPKEGRRKALGYLESARDIYRTEKEFSKVARIEEDVAKFAEDNSDLDLQVSASKQALHAYRQAVTLKPKRASEFESKISILFDKIAGLLSQSKDKEAARQFFDEVLAVSTDWAAKAKIIGRVAHFYKDKDAKEAVRYLGQQRDLYRQNQRFYEEGNTSMEIGSVYGASGQSAEMLKAFDDALIAYRKIGDEQPGNPDALLADVIRIGDSYAKSDKQRALAIYKEALDFGRRNKYPVPEMLESIIDKVGEILLEPRTNESDTKVRQFFESTVAVFQKHGYSYEFELRSAIGRFYEKLGDKKEARAAYNLALTIMRDNDFASYRHTQLFRRVAAFETKGDPGKSEGDFYLSEAEYARVNRDPRTQALALELAAAFYRGTDNQKALDYFYQARALYNQTGLKAREAEVLRLISYLFEGKGDRQKAIELRKEADLIHKP